jgi:hypothetical protein
MQLWFGNPNINNPMFIFNLTVEKYTHFSYLYPDLLINFLIVYFSNLSKPCSDLFGQRRSEFGIIQRNVYKGKKPES